MAATEDRSLLEAAHAARHTCAWLLSRSVRITLRCFEKVLLVK
jgi:hypothetical protein